MKHRGARISPYGVVESFVIDFSDIGNEIGGHTIHPNFIGKIVTYSGGVYTFPHLAFKKLKEVAREGSLPK
jgi:hypothetical protein